jgi:hypothetical protein
LTGFLVMSSGALRRRGGARFGVVDDPGVDDWSRLASELVDGTVVGAAYVRALSAQVLPRAAGRTGAVLVEPAAANVVGWLIEQGWAIESDELWFVLLPPAAQPRVVAAEDFAGLVDSAVPAVVHLPLADASPDDERLFGGLATTRAGGSCALLSLSGARPGDEAVLLHNPAALGLARVDNDARSLAAHATTGAVRCTALGLSDADEQAGLDRFDDVAACAELWDSRDRGRNQFWLILELVAPAVDPPVWVPAGQVFEQFGLNGRQTLATSTGLNTVVAPGRITTVLTPAFCLDAHLASPSADPMRATPLRVPLAPGATQEQVWRQRATARGVRT